MWELFGMLIVSDLNTTAHAEIKRLVASWIEKYDPAEIAVRYADHGFYYVCLTDQTFEELQAIRLF
jgi:hypothetical protein